MFRRAASAVFEAHSRDRKSTRLNSSHLVISYAVFCLKKKKKHHIHFTTKNPRGMVCLQIIRVPFSHTIIVMIPAHATSDIFSVVCVLIEELYPVVSSL